MIEEIPQEAKCKICNRVLKEPTQVSCCNSNYCFNCINTQIETNSTCPFCSKSLDQDQLYPNKILLKVIQSENYVEKEQQNLKIQENIKQKLTLNEHMFSQTSLGNIEKPVNQDLTNNLTNQLNMNQEINKEETKFQEVKIHQSLPKDIVTNSKKNSEDFVASKERSQSKENDKVKRATEISQNQSEHIQSLSHEKNQQIIGQNQINQLQDLDPSKPNMTQQYPDYLRQQQYNIMMMQMQQMKYNPFYFQYNPYMMPNMMNPGFPEYSQQNAELQVDRSQDRNQKPKKSHRDKENSRNRKSEKNKKSKKKRQRSSSSRSRSLSHRRRSKKHK